MARVEDIPAVEENDEERVSQELEANVLDRVISFVLGIAFDRLILCVPENFTVSENPDVLEIASVGSKVFVEAKLLDIESCRLCCSTDERVNIRVSVIRSVLMKTLDEIIVCDCVSLRDGEKADDRENALVGANREDAVNAFVAVINGVIEKLLVILSEPVRENDRVRLKLRDALKTSVARCASDLECSELSSKADVSEKKSPDTDIPSVSENGLDSENTPEARNSREATNRSDFVLRTVLSKLIVFTNRVDPVTVSERTKRDDRTRLRERSKSFDCPKLPETDIDVVRESDCDRLILPVHENASDKLNRCDATKVELGDFLDRALDPENPFVDTGLTVLDILLEAE
jgi:hypothetical protein